MKKFAILGVGGYIAPRHIEAIQSTGNKLCLAMDINDSVGILDRYSQDIPFFTDYERFESKLESLKDKNEKVDYVSICSPNHLHKSHIKLALRNGCNVICEKPLVLTESEIDEIKEYEERYNGKVNTVLQLRLHDSIVELKKKIERSNNKNYDVELTYLTSRGPWYHESWKGDISKSGGLATNIGIHFFDMLCWFFGSVKKNELHIATDKIMSGFLEYENARVKWILGIDKEYLPDIAKKDNKTTYRSIKINGEEVEFSGGFTNLHCRVYEHILKGSGYGLEDNRKAIRIVEKLRSETPLGIKDYSHPSVKFLKP